MLKRAFYGLPVFYLPAEILYGGGRSLYAATGQAPPPQERTGLLFFGVLLLVIGLVSIIYPRLFWWLRVGHKIPHVAPVKGYLTLLRIGGLLVCALALYILLKLL